MSHDAAGEELVDVVDEDDRVIATVSRAWMRAERLPHRGVFVVVRRSDGRILVHRRSADKDIWPSAWDIAVGGVVHSGEAWEAAAVRELAEEVGVTGVTPRLRRAGRYVDGDVVESGRVYEVTWDGPVTFNDGEVVTAEWLTPDELATRLQGEDGAGRFCPDSLALAGDLLR